MARLSLVSVIGSGPVENPSLLTCLLSDSFKIQISTFKATFYSPVTGSFYIEPCDTVFVCFSLTLYVNKYTLHLLGSWRS